MDDCANRSKSLPQVLVDRYPPLCRQRRGIYTNGGGQVLLNRLGLSCFGAQFMTEKQPVRLEAIANALQDLGLASFRLHRQDGFCQHIINQIVRGCVPDGV